MGGLGRLADCAWVSEGEGCGCVCDVCVCPKGLLPCRCFDSYLCVRCIPDTG